MNLRPDSWISVTLYQIPRLVRKSLSSLAQASASCGSMSLVGLIFGIRQSQYLFTEFNLPPEHTRLYKIVVGAVVSQSELCYPLFTVALHGFPGIAVCVELGR